MLRGKGIHYDTGTFPNGDTSRPVFDPRDAERDIQVVAEDLHCTAVRITGGDPDRIETTARYAAQAGLEVWFSPFPCELTNAEMLPLFADCAERAERLRRDGAEVVLVTGCELSIFARGYLPGDIFNERVPVLAGPGREAALRGIPDKVNTFLAEVVDTVRPLFGGRISYASCPLDGVDWTPFDIVGLDAFRGQRNAATYRADLRAECARGKPVAVMEAGCCTYRGAGDHGGAGWYMAKESDGITLRPGLVRDEGEQVRYLEDLMTVFEEVGVDSAFWFSFAGFSTPHRTTGPDEDLASYGIVKILDEHSDYPVSQRTYPDMPWEPKEAFHALARRYGADGK
ncbi:MULTISPECIES: hypothetical protein [Streptomyces]|uniref:Abortive infection protein n=2 Tax=Streptomyces rimosus subsp. rimosus TaxID=132474 RepID=L8EGF9_STRR1|nr:MULTISPECIES: hypothetical protein [Streptomyces]MYT46080.1 hypothetical protein [Streptomyces sp. SID5471]KUJ41674.1 hypothetical protein ADK46_06280 [Streptomyces rimosus subsp. rimosus]QDA02963.1 hypothetical protein CTZ40_03500 [Streptomyces rimosus]QEV74235.1 hypothetical protein CP984_03485 [Streptomyces rimosus]QGY66055.1 hypothetical protein V519_009215 [Streptomyces rimosus R6-500]